MPAQSLKAYLAIAFGYGASAWCTASALRRERLMREAQFWLGTTGKVLESAVYRDPQRNALNFRIRYEFTVGERIEGATPRLCGHWFWTNRRQAEFVGRYRAGQTVEVFYDPRDPRRNCLDRDDRSGITALWIIAAGGTVLASFLVWLTCGS
jgi:hypothetical protein